jgi:hypothetical protein
MKLTEAQHNDLLWLYRMGGSGHLDRYGRLVAGGETKNQGSTVAWLNLVIKGMIVGGEDRLVVSDKGRDYARHHSK